MANKERNKRSARKARQRERAEHEALVAESSASSGKKQRGGAKKAAQAAKKAPVKVASDARTGLIGRTRGYLSDVRSEMRRVTWPSRSELTSYSVAVVAMLIVFGICVWLVDTGVVAALVAFTSLRG